MKTMSTFPEGLLQLKMCGQSCAAEHKGVYKAFYSVFDTDRKTNCHVFHLIADPENYPNYKSYSTMNLWESQVQRYIKLIGTVKVAG